MKVISEVANPTSHGFKRTHNAKIEANIHSFEALSDSLYAYKIRAIVRELSTNAIDGLKRKWRNLNPNRELTAEVIQNELDKFVVHLPTWDEPYFSIRDYGCGLNHEGITSLFTDYFVSDKRDSDDETGCLGLGSKSPYAYTDGFSVISYFNGWQTDYMCCLDQTGPGCYTKLDENDEPIPTQTDEPNGLYINIAVKSGDINDFAEEAQYVYQTFEKLPEIEGNPNFEFEPLEFEVEGSNWNVRNSDGLGPRAIMCNVAYPIEDHPFRDEVAEDVYSVLGLDIDIYFAPGDVKFQISREGLSYKPHTVATIKERLGEISQELADRVTTAVAGAANKWQARCLARKFFYDGGSIFSNVRFDMSKIVYDGEALSANTIPVGEKHYANTDVYLFELRRKRGWNNGYAVKRVDIATLEPNVDVTFINIDLPRGAYSRIEYAVDQKLYDRVVAIRFKDPAEKDTILGEIGISESDMVKASGLVEAPKDPTKVGTRYKNASQIFKYCDGYRNRQYDSWSSETVDLTAGGVYVEMCRYRYKDKNGNFRVPAELNYRIKLLKKFGVDVGTVIGVRSKLAKKFRESDDWVDIWTYSQNVFDNMLANDDLTTHLANVQEVEKLSFKRDYDEGLNKVVQDIEADDFRSFVADVSLMKESYNKTQGIGLYDWNNFARDVDRNIELSNPTVGDLKQREDGLSDTYELYSTIIGSVNEKILTNYINLVDKARQADII